MPSIIIIMDRETKLDMIELSRGYIGAILLAILMFTGVVSGLYAGESMTFETNLTNPYYLVVGNSSDIEGLNVSFENGNITISTVVNFRSDNFTLIFFDNVTNEVEKIVYRGGSGGTYYIEKIVNQTVNQTVYVPKYIETAEVVEVEKIIDDTIVLETGYQLWHVFLAMALGCVFGWLVIGRKEVGDVEDEEDEEETTNSKG